LRLVELAFGLNNKWARGGWIDFFDYLFIFGLMGVAIFRMKLVARLGKALVQQGLFPNLHRDQNFLKAWQEFQFFFRWGFCVQLITFVSFSFIGMLYGIDKGWF
jgi:hypothetical protein